MDPGIRRDDGTKAIGAVRLLPMRDQKIADVEQGKPESVWTSEQLGRPVIKAFNAALAHTLAENGQPHGTPKRIAMPLAGDDSADKTIVEQLVDAAGFDPVDAGTLAESWRQQPGTPPYCTELQADELRQALAAADKDRAPGNRDAVMGEFMQATTPPAHDHIIERHRAISAPPLISFTPAPFPNAGSGTLSFAAGGR